MIQALNPTLASNLCAGQVIVSVCSATKELIENALDAESTVIDIRIKNHGLESVQVKDNGHGISIEDASVMAIRNMTSKLKKFEDLSNMTSFGFRGEALNSLCALSNVYVITRRHEAPTSSRIEFDHHGNVKHIKTVSEPPGTSVTFTDLFCTLPVRRNEFEKNAKKEFAQLISMIHAYALICSDVIFRVSHQDKNGAKTKILSTTGKNGLSGSICSIYGARTLSTLCKVDSLLGEWAYVVGYVSQNDLKTLKKTNSYQHLFLNRRPVDLVRVTKAIQEVYKNLNGTIQRSCKYYPVIILNFSISPSKLDVNVTPDKRQVVIENEPELINYLVDLLTRLLGSQLKNFNVQNQIHSQEKDQGIQNLSLEWLRQGTESETHIKESEDQDKETVKVSAALEGLKRLKTCGVVTREADRRKVTNSNEQEIEAEENGVHLQDYSTVKRRDLQTMEKGPECWIYEEVNKNDGKEGKKHKPDHIEHGEDISVHENVLFEPPTSSRSADSKFSSLESKLSKFICGNGSINLDSDASENSGSKDISLRLSVNSSDIERYNIAHSSSCNYPKILKTDPDGLYEEVGSLSKPPSATLKIPFNFKLYVLRIKSKIQALERLQKPEVSSIHFRGKIGETDIEEMQAELYQKISKSDFLNMQVIGQFNKGFIVVQLKDNLFILDQHASHEKYLYECLQNTKLNTQKLLSPIQLELTVADQSIVLENLDLFQMNGFQFEFIEDAPLLHRLRMVSYPFTKSLHLGAAGMKIEYKKSIIFS
ncbi:mismatch repair endonuclease PMS2-like [Schistocerca gregaria]|uniref:mismatch repair endonuclease PMS2-like n=1 Tax=Schistocerca gregaria TaxID=7010 RepID=UPI00211F0256|nr:mismatch repair endonuclease PMS2-like [Schistocerca gregaria]